MLNCAASGKEVTSVLGNRVFIRPETASSNSSAAEVEQSIPSRFELIVAKYPSHLAVTQNDLEVSL